MSVATQAGTIDTSLTQSNHLLALARRGVRLPRLPVVLLFVVGFIVGVNLLALGPLLILIAVTGQTEPGASDSALRSGLHQAVLLILSFAPFYALLWFWLRAFEGRPFWTLGFERAGAAWKYARGLLIGVLSFSVVVGLLAAPGAVATEEGYAGRQGLAALAGVLVVAVGWVVQGAAEEALCRGWILPTVGARYRLWIGVAVNALIFAILHGLNPNIGPLAVLNLGVVGLFLSLYALREGGLWGVCGWHAAWNWAQGNLYGFEVSGTLPAGGMLLNLREAGPDPLTGGAFGPEGGLAVTAVLAVGSAFLLLRGARRGVERGA